MIFFFYGVWNSSEEYVSKGLPVPGSGVPVSKQNGFGDQPTFDLSNKASLASDLGTLSMKVVEPHITEDAKPEESGDESHPPAEVDVPQEVTKAEVNDSFFLSNRIDEIR